MIREFRTNIDSDHDKFIMNSLILFKCLDGCNFWKLFSCVYILLEMECRILRIDIIWLWKSLNAHNSMFKLILCVSYQNVSFCRKTCEIINFKIKILNIVIRDLRFKFFKNMPQL